KKNKSAECRIIVVANPKPDKAIITKISVEEGIPITLDIKKKTKVLNVESLLSLILNPTRQS
ncbi:hypothetical protein OHF07_25835, partial [Escherichia coli]|nr:hypothetical protein [Escherichia coli]